MLTPSTFERRRAHLHSILGKGTIVLGGHIQLPRNLPMNLTPGRQSSHILYLAGVRDPAATLLFQLESNTVELFFPDHEPGDEIWHGSPPPESLILRASGANHVYPLSQLEARIRYHHSRHASPLYSLPSSDPGWSSRMAPLGLELPAFGKLARRASSPLADAMAAVRLAHDGEAMEEMREAAKVNALAHKAAMMATHVGGHEAQIRGLIEGIWRSAGMSPAYDSIVTVRGEVLHCRSNPNRFNTEDLLLVDAGCETQSGYASDVTRVWPARGKFDAKQRDIYDIVLAAQQECIERVRPQADFLDLHLHAARVIATGLRDLGLFQGSIDDLVESDAHALFFPHGLGHLIGLDVHDAEDLGDRIGYAPERERSSRFGLAWLRFSRKLEPGMAVTIEPGIYFIPALLNDPQRQEQYRQHVNFDLARTYLNFGGIRIEDDVVVRDGSPEVLSSAIPKDINTLETLVGSAPELLGALARVQP